MCRDGACPVSTFILSVDRTCLPTGRQDTRLFFALRKISSSGVGVKSCACSDLSTRSALGGSLPTRSSPSLIHIRVK